MSEIKLPPALLPGSKLDKYTIERLTGRGKTTEVYRALHPDYNNTVAIKLYHHAPEQRAEVMAHFRQDIAMIATLKHPNIIRIYDFGHHHNALFVVMEFVAGTRLRDMISSHPTGLNREDALRIFSQIASAVAYVHDQGIVHGNLQPDNILLDPTTRPVLIDFNIPCLAESKRFGALSNRIPTYLSPHQIRQQTATPACDIYALGILLYEMITGDVPFKGQTYASVAEQHKNTLPTPPGQIAVGLDPRIEQAILKALNKIPDMRHTTARAMLHELENKETNQFETLSLTRNQITQRSKRRSEIIRFEQSRSDMPAASGIEQAFWLNRSRLMVIGGVLLLAVIAVIVAALLL
ncbi:MAG: serine/threonine protein kinase [Anaerolineae bacterium]|nr:serine/threonine protein kinase [Anaerolineae bacterium]